MWPYLIDFGVWELGRWGPIHVLLPTYGLLLLLGLLVGLLCTVRVATWNGVPSETILDIMLPTYIAGFVGAKIYAIVFAVVAGASPLKAAIDCGQHAGSTLAGLAIGSCVVASRLRKPGLKIARLADLAIPGMSLGLAVSRVGCFAAGCCYGRPTQSFIGVAFPPFDTPAVRAFGAGTSLVPTQLLEAGFQLVVAFTSQRLLSVPLRPGVLALGYVGAYCAARAILGNYRPDNAGVLARLLCFLAVCAAVLAWRHQRRGGAGV